MMLSKTLALLIISLLPYSSLRSETVNLKEVDIFKSTPMEILPFAEQIQDSAKHGNAIDQLRLSVLYSRGIGLNKDPVAARNWLTKSADAGNADANYFIGQIYLFGTGSDKNKSEAIRRLKKSGDKKHIKGSQLAGSMLYGMYGKDFIDINQAVKFLETSSKAGDGLSSFLLSCLYRYDIKNDYKSNEYIEKSIEQDYPIAKNYSKSNDHNYLKNKCAEFRRN